MLVLLSAIINHLMSVDIEGLRSEKQQKAYLLSSKKKKNEKLNDIINVNVITPRHNPFV